MSLQNFDTFEQDIAQELKKKEVTIRDIAATNKNIEAATSDIPEKKSPLIFIVLGILLLGSLSGASYFGYTFYLSAITPQILNKIATLPVVKTKESVLAELSPQLANNIGMFVSSIDKSKDGYTLRLSSFSPVYAYMLRNEKDYADDVANALGVKHGTQVASITYDAATSIITIASTSSSTITVSTTTTKNSKALSQGSTTTATTTLAPTPAVIVPVDTSTKPLPFIFSDITVSNQNMRMAVSGENSYYYAFIGNKALVFSTSPEGILNLKNAILR